MKTIVIGGFSGIGNEVIKYLNKKKSKIIYTYTSTNSNKLKSFRGFKLNTKEEIFLSIKDMHLRLQNKVRYTQEQIRLKNQFNKSMKKINNYKNITEKLNIDISMSFLELNQNLI